jgi:hypothetical protein
MKNFKRIIVVSAKNWLLVLSATLSILTSCSKAKDEVSQQKLSIEHLQDKLALNYNTNTESYSFRDSINSGIISALTTLQQQLFWTIVSATEVAEAQENSFSAWNPYMAVSESLLSTVDVPYDPLTYVLNAWPGEAFPTDVTITPSYSFTNIMDIIPSLSTIITNMQENYSNNSTIYIFVNKGYSVGPNSSTPLYDLYITYAPIFSEPYVPVMEEPNVPPPTTPNPTIQIYFTKGAGDQEITIVYPIL